MTPDKVFGLTSLARPFLRLGPVQLLITDGILPGMSGDVGLAERLVASRPHLRTIWLSGHTADAIIPRAGQGPNFVFLSKLFSLNTLARKVLAILDKNSSAQREGTSNVDVPEPATDERLG